MKYPFKKQSYKLRNEIRNAMTVSTLWSRCSSLINMGHGEKEPTGETQVWSSREEWEKYYNRFDGIYGGCSSSASENSTNHDKWLSFFALRLYNTEIQNPKLYKKIMEAFDNKLRNKRGL